jgi:hypothetical protein
MPSAFFGFVFFYLLVIEYGKLENHIEKKIDEKDI